MNCGRRGVWIERESVGPVMSCVENTRNIGTDDIFVWRVRCRTALPPCGYTETGGKVEGWLLCATLKKGHFTTNAPPLRSRLWITLTELTQAQIFWWTLSWDITLVIESAIKLRDICSRGSGNGLNRGNFWLYFWPTSGKHKLGSKSWI